MQSLQTLNTPDSGLKERRAALDDLIASLEQHEDMTAELEVALARRAAIQHRLSLKQELDSAMAAVRNLPETAGAQSCFSIIYPSLTLRASCNPALGIVSIICICLRTAMPRLLHTA
jgi:hypothetical protein